MGGVATERHDRLPRPARPWTPSNSPRPVLARGVFGYDPLSGLYQFNWKTEKTWTGSCRRLLVRLDDGTVHTADFRMQ